MFQVMALFSCDARATTNPKMCALKLNVAASEPPPGGAGCPEPRLMPLYFLYVVSISRKVCWPLAVRILNFPDHEWYHSPR